MTATPSIEICVQWLPRRTRRARTWPALGEIAVEREGTASGAAERFQDHQDLPSWHR
jgi:hypothetical protein